MESADSSCGCHHPQLPPGFRFHPTDEELVVHYLKRKVDSAPLPVAIVAEVDLYKFDPWELPAKATFGEQEWYFFSPRNRKYPNGARPNRATTCGYWKATGTDKPVLTSGSRDTKKVGVKKALVFYEGKPPTGIKTNWIMHEYRVADNKPTIRPPAYNLDLANKKGSLRLDDWVLCRIYKKKNTQTPVDHDGGESMNNMLGQQNSKLAALKASTYGGLMENENNVFDGIISNVSDGIDKLAASGSNSKRTLPNLFWNDEGAKASLLTKRFRTDNEDDNNNSVARLLGQLPQNQRAMMGSLGDGLLTQQYQVSGMDWYC